MSDDQQKGYEHALRTEIIESQNTQADFLKWKLISVAGIASIALGLGPSSTPAVAGAKLLMCSVPLICAYVDLISLQITNRILLIGLYLKQSGNAYEKFVFKVRDKTTTNPFVFEAAAMIVSSGVFNAIVVTLGFTLPKGAKEWPAEYLTAYIVSGVAGIFVTTVLWLIHSSRRREITRVAESTEV